MLYEKVTGAMMGIQSQEEGMGSGPVWTMYGIISFWSQLTARLSKQDREFIGICYSMVHD